MELYKCHKNPFSLQSYIVLPAATLEIIFKSLSKPSVHRWNISSPQRSFRQGLSAERRPRSVSGGEGAEPTEPPATPECCPVTARLQTKIYILAFERDFNTSANLCTREHVLTNARKCIFNPLSEETNITCRFYWYQCSA